MSHGAGKTHRDDHIAEWTADDHASEKIELNSETPGDFG